MKNGQTDRETPLKMETGADNPVPSRTVELFHSLEYIDSRKSAFGASVLVHVVMLLVLSAVPLVFTDSLKLKYDVVTLVPPVERVEPPLIETRWIPLAPPPPALRPPVQPVVEQPFITPEQPRQPEPEKVEARLPDEVRIPKIDTPETPELPPPSPHRLAESEPTVAPPKIAIRTNVFSQADASASTTNAPPRDVQTGGFGDPNGLPVNGASDKAANIASLGKFDLPAGPGAGNGSGGTRGIRGVAPGSGFGGATAAQSSRTGSDSGKASDRTVRQAGFEQVEAAPPKPPAKKADDGPPDKPVEITFKPRPDYSDEARKLRLEGEVLLRVLFSGGGQVSVIEVVRGLGHGLDENAIRAAQQIRFKPAVRAGQPADFTATVHIVFQLAF